MKKKVAFFGEILIRDFDGASRTMYNIIDRIPTEDFEFVFFCGVPPKIDIGYRVEKFPVVPIPFNSTYKMTIPYFHKKKLYKLLDEMQPDVIHIASPSPLGQVALTYAEDRNIPAIGIYHTHFISYMDYYFGKLKALLPFIKRKVVKNQRKFYDRMYKIFVPTKQMIHELGGYSFDTKNMILWQRGMDHTVFNPQAVDRQALRSLTKNDYPNIIFASRLVWEKNLQTLADIYQMSKDLGLNYNFIIAGDGVAREKLQSKMPDAFFLGHVDQNELATLYSSSDVFLFPSVTETFGNVVAEAMACGCPCVVAAGGGSQSHVTHMKNGILVKPNNAEQYVNAINTILTDEVLRNNMIKNGIEYTSNFDWDKLCKDYFVEVSNIIDRRLPKAKPRQKPVPSS